MEQNPVEDGVKDSRGEVMSVHYRCVDLHCSSRRRCRLPRADSLSLSLPLRARRPEEAIYLLPSSDRVTVVFSTIFKEETDRILGKVFLQEFVDARRRPSCQTAPQVLYSNREPPLEIRHLKGLDMTERAGYVTFGASASPFLLSRVRPRAIRRADLLPDLSHSALPSPLYASVVWVDHHADPGASSRFVLSLDDELSLTSSLSPPRSPLSFPMCRLQQLFRDFLHYNIKCSKAYLHSRLRVRTTSFLKVLRRAQPEPVEEGERKTARCVLFPRARLAGAKPARSVAPTAIARSES